eukprot:218472-Pleurochrysis_carterae.AAC.1
MNASAYYVYTLRYVAQAQDSAARHNMVAAAEQDENGVLSLLLRRAEFENADSVVNTYVCIRLLERSGFAWRQRRST